MTKENLQEWLDRVTADTPSDNLAVSQRGSVGSEQMKLGRPPWVVEYVRSRCADKVFCGQCNSVYYISESMLSSQLYYNLLYSRFSNEIYMYTGWHTTTPAFRDALKFYLESYPTLFYPPRLQGDRTLHAFDTCPYCEAYIPNENWSTVPGYIRIPYLEPPPGVNAQNQPHENPIIIKRLWERVKLKTQ